MEGGAVGFGNIIEEQLQLEGMRRSLSGNRKKWKNQDLVLWVTHQRYDMRFDIKHSVVATFVGTQIEFNA